VPILAVVLPPLHLVEVAVEVVALDLMVRTHECAVKQAPRALDALRVDGTAHPFLGAVVDRFVPGVLGVK